MRDGQGLRIRSAASLTPNSVQESSSRDLYRNAGHEMLGMHAAEHTAQVRPDVREEREAAFREGNLGLLFCSPTMELGVDIASLNAVGMRNVPPTPANYAQRSGRAGRSGQPALVATYCSSGNSHDSYYFQRSNLMVSGQVQPPRLDLANEDLVRSHVHATWLAEALSMTSGGLSRSMAEVLDLGATDYPVRPELNAVLADIEVSGRAKVTVRSLLAPLMAELSGAAWWSDDWSDNVVDHATQSFHKACDRWRDLYRSAAAERDAAYELGTLMTSNLRRKDREEADERYREARQRIELLINESDNQGQSDFYTYRYLASEGFLPGYSFPRLPLAAFIPGSRGRSGSWLQRARFLAITEFGPGALIYHEGARYQVTRISLPRGTSGESDGEVVRTRAKVCGDCGYHHRADVGLEMCESCGHPLRDTWRELIQLQTVITRRRERISADEEERNRVGFELVTTYRFTPRGKYSGRSDADIRSERGDLLATLSYGDGAEIRATNLGRRNRKNLDVHGFNLDLVKGRWLKDQDTNADADDEDDFEAALEDVKRKARVTPYVEDRRNIAVLRWSDPVTDAAAVTLQHALERGIEATFQLEDSELTSQRLPDDEERGRLLFIEAAEGGAGVLRRLHSEPDALSRLATAALGIMHVDPDSGEDFSDACVRGCYRCLLSYGNQTVHEMIDRRLAVPMLMELTGARSEPDESPQAQAPEKTAVATALTGAPSLAAPDSRVEQLLALLIENELRIPTEQDVTLEGMRVDMLYRDVISTAVIVLDKTHPNVDADALVFAGYNVVKISLDADLMQVIGANPGVFGALSA